MLQTNIFAVMIAKLKQANEKWIKPVIIIDEFQYLKNIIIDKEDNLTLVEELWKFFIAMTKVQHLAHVVCLTSDSYYVEELYSHAKLKNTSKYYLVDHLSEKDIQYWLWEKEWLSDEIVKYFRENLGGSVREIRQALVDYKNTWDYQKPIQIMIQDEYAKTVELYNTTFTKEEQSLFSKISKEIAKKWEFLIPIWENYFQIIKKLVDLDIRFYDVRNQRIIANSQSVRKVFQKMFG